MDDDYELITDSFVIVDGLTEKQRKDLLVLLLTLTLKKDPENAMRYIVRVKEEDE